MFVKAIRTVGAFTRPIQSISRSYGSKDVIPGAATLFFVNFIRKAFSEDKESQKS